MTKVRFINSDRLNKINALIEKQKEVLSRVVEQKAVISDLIAYSDEAKRSDAALNEKLIKAKARSDWAEACKEHGINPESSYNTFKRTV